MNANQLLAHFDSIADAPDALPRLRRFVLDLAVRGKLVPQDLEDEPAAELLERIAKEKARLVKAGEIRKPRLIADGEDISFPFEIPACWQWVRLGSVGTIVGGGTPSANDADNFTEPGAGIPWLTPADLGGFSGSFISHGARDLSEKGFQNSSASLVPVGTVLFTSRAPIGYVAIAANPVSTNQGFKSIVPYVPDCSRFIVLAMKTFAPEINARAPGTTFKEVSGKIVARIPFPLPPLAEQRRIVAKVDELMGLCDRLETAQTERETTRTRLTAASFADLNAPDPDEARFQEHAKFVLDNFASLTARPEQVKVLRHTILNLAVQGKLVPQDPADKPAAELLKLIQIEKASLIKLRKIKTDKHSCPAVRDGLNFSLKPGWISVRLRQILLELQTGPFGSSLHQSDYEKAGTPVVNPASIQNGRIVPIEKMAVGSTTLERLAAFRLRQRDIVMSRRGEMGRCAKVTEREDGWLCGTGSLILRLPKCIYSCFLVILLGSPYVREYLNGSAVGATMQNLNQSILLNLVIGLPPLAEQQRIVAKVDKLMRLCDRLERSVETEDHKRTLLVEALLCRSVSNPGIVPSDRSDSNALRNAVQGHELEAT